MAKVSSEEKYSTWRVVEYEIWNDGDSNYVNDILPTDFYIRVRENIKGNRLIQLLKQVGFMKQREYYNNFEINWSEFHCNTMPCTIAVDRKGEPYCELRRVPDSQAYYGSIKKTLVSQYKEDMVNV